MTDATCCGLFVLIGAIVVIATVIYWRDWKQVWRKRK